MKNKITMVFTVALLVIGTGHKGFAQGQESEQGQDLQIACRIANDFYIVNLTAYVQPTGMEADPTSEEYRRIAFKRHCQEIPTTGKIFFSMDLIDTDTRELPVGVVLLKEEAEGEPTVIKEEDAIIRKTGIVETVAEIKHPGKYKLQLSFGDVMMDDDLLDIPLWIGIKPKSQEMSPATKALFAGLLLLIIGFLAYRYFSQRESRMEI